MRKFTTIASALMLGGIGFMANAAVSTETATVNPAPGLVGPYDLPTNITVNWANNTLSFVEGSSLSLPLVIDGAESTSTANATVSGTDLNISINAWIEKSVSLTIPEGVLYFNGSDVTNPELELTYVAAPMEGDYVLSPAAQTHHFSVSSVTISAEGFKLGVTNGTDLEVTYGEKVFDWETFESTWQNQGTLTAKDVTTNSDGSVTLTLPAAYANVGMLNFEVPQGFLTVSNDEGSLLAEGLTFAYIIDSYQTLPATDGLVFAPLSNNMYVYASQSIEYVGNADQVTVTLNANADDETSVKAGSVTATTVDGYPAIQIALAEALNPTVSTDVAVNVPANLLKVNGSYLTEDVNWNFTLAAGPTAEPANGWYGTALESVSLNWAMYPVEINEDATVYPTVTYGENVVNIADYATLEDREGENGQGMTVTYQALVFDLSELNLNETNDYVVTIPEGYVSLAYSDDNYLPNSEVVLTYHVIASSAYTLDPADGAELSELSNISLTYEAANIGIYTESQMVGALYNASTDEELYTAYAQINGEKGENGESKFNIYFVDPNAEVAEGETAQEVTVTAPGHYMVRLQNFYQAVVEEGEEVADLAQNPIVAYYTIIPQDYATFDPASGSQVDDLSTVVVTFSEKVGYLEGTTPAVAILENTSTGDLWYCQNPINNTKYENGPGYQYTLSFSELGSEEAVTIDGIGNYILTLKGWYNDVLENGTDEDGVDQNVYSFLPTITASYSIIPEGFVSYEPATEETLSEISQITVTFAENVGWNSDVRPGAAILENLSTGATYYCYAPFKQTKAETEGAVYVLDFYEMGGEEPVTIDEIGYYELSLHGVYMSEQEDEDGDMIYNYLPVFTTYYSVLSDNFYTLDPAAGSTVSDLSTITIEFDGQVGFIPGVRPAAALLENTTTGNIWYCENPMRDTKAESEGSVYVLEFSELGSTEPVEITEAGNYILRINGAYIGEDYDAEGDMLYKQLPVITVEYSLYPENYFTLTPESGMEVDELSTVTLTFNGNSNVGISPLRPAPIVLENLTTGDVWYCENPMQTRLDDGSKQFTIYFTSLGSSVEETININGEYLLTVKGLYESVINEDETETDSDLPNITATYYIVNGVTGIESVIESDSYTVYGINGILMLKDGKASDVNALNPGLYIINGKKVIIRK